MKILRVAVGTGRWDLAAHAIVLASARAVIGGMKDVQKKSGKRPGRRGGKQA